MEESQKLNKDHVEEEEKLVDQSRIRNKSANRSKNNNNINDADNREHMHVGTEHYSKEGQRK